jgi:hypothetical protein
MQVPKPKPLTPLKRVIHLKPTCDRGHEYTTESAYVDSSGVRICRECRRIRQAKSRAPKATAK